MSIGGQDHNQPQLFKRLIADAGAVANRIDQLGAELTHHYSGKRPLFICLLRGGAPFATQLMFAITRLDPVFHPELDYMTITTYGDKRTGGDPRIVMDQAPKTEPEGRSVVILDDVLDMGITAAFTRKVMEERGALDVALCVLVQKQTGRTLYGDADWYGFEAPADWLTGMGMDDHRVAPEANRWLDQIAIADSDS